MANAFAVVREQDSRSRHIGAWEKDTAQRHFDAFETYSGGLLILDSVIIDDQNGLFVHLGLDSLHYRFLR